MTWHAATLRCLTAYTMQGVAAEILKQCEFGLQSYEELTWTILMIIMGRFLCTLHHAFVWILFADVRLHNKAGRVTNRLQCCQCYWLHWGWGCLSKNLSHSQTALLPVCKHLWCMKTGQAYSTTKLCPAKQGTTDTSRNQCLSATHFSKSHWRILLHLHVSVQHSEIHKMAYIIARAEGWVYKSKSTDSLANL